MSDREAPIREALMYDKERAARQEAARENAALRKALDERAMHWEHDAEEAEVAANSYRGHDEEAAVDLFRQAARARSRATELRAILASVPGDATEPGYNLVHAAEFVDARNESSSVPGDATETPRESIESYAKRSGWMNDPDVEPGVPGVVQTPEETP